MDLEYLNGAHTACQKIEILSFRKLLGKNYYTDIFILPIATRENHWKSVP